jgi:RNA polymerase sigma-70 factor, ECF subfamily
MILAQVKEQEFSLDARELAVMGGADDHALMEGVAARDPAALQRLYDRHAPLVLALIVRILHDRSEAEDVMVDVFWELWDRFERFDAKRGSPLTYLTTLARSRAIDRRRSRAKIQPVNIDTSAPAAAPLADGPDRGVVADENRVLVKRALFDLDPAQREAIECAFYDGLTHTEIAEKLGKPLGTVKTCIRQGLIRLRQSLRITNGGDA